MLKSIIFCILSVFSICGFISLVFLLFNSTLDNIPYVLGVHNKENEIESILKKLLKEHPCTKIIVVDMNSSDSTCEIVRKMAKKNPCIIFIDKYHNNMLLR